ICATSLESSQSEPEIVIEWLSRARDTMDFPASSDDWLRNPITGIDGCCARAASGHVTEPAIILMKPRRRIAAPRIRSRPDTGNYIRDLRQAKWVQRSVCTTAIVNG